MGVQVNGAWPMLHHEHSVGAAEDWHLASSRISRRKHSQARRCEYATASDVWCERELVTTGHSAEAVAVLAQTCTEMLVGCSGS